MRTLQRIYNNNNNRKTRTSSYLQVGVDAEACVDGENAEFGSDKSGVGATAATNMSVEL